MEDLDPVGDAGVGRDFGTGLFDGSDFDGSDFDGFDLGQGSRGCCGAGSVGRAAGLPSLGSGRS